MTAENYSYLNVIGAVAALILPAWQLIKNTEKKGIRRITPIGWVLIGASIYIAVISGLVVSSSSKEKKISDSTSQANDSLSAKKYTDSLKSFSNHTIEMLAKYGLKVDSTNGVIVKKLDSISGKTAAIITLLPGSDCGFTFTRVENKFIFNGFVKNSGDETAYFVCAGIRLIACIDDKLQLKQTRPNDSIPGHNITGMLMTNVIGNVEFVDSSAFDAVKNFIVIIDGSYYLDYERKIPREIQLSFLYTPKNRNYTIVDWAYAMSINNSAEIQ